MKRVSLELILNDNNQDVVKSIERVLQSQSHAPSSSSAGEGSSFRGAPQPPHSAYPSPAIVARRYNPSSSVSTPSSAALHPYYAYGSGAKSAYSLISNMSGLTEGDMAAMRNAYSANGARGQAAMPLMQYHPGVAAAAAAADFHPNFGELAYNYNAMVAAMVASAGHSGNSAGGASGKGLPPGFSYGLFPSPRKSGSSHT